MFMQLFTDSSGLRPTAHQPGDYITWIRNILFNHDDTDEHSSNDGVDDGSGEKW